MEGRGEENRRGEERGGEQRRRGVHGEERGEIMHKRQTNKLTLDTKGKKITKKFQIIKKRSFSTRFSINVFYSSISLSFPQRRGLCSARKMCCSSLHSCLLFVFLTPPADASLFFSHSSSHEFDLDCTEYC